MRIDKANLHKENLRVYLNETESTEESAASTSSLKGRVEDVSTESRARLNTPIGSLGMEIEQFLKDLDLTNLDFKEERLVVPVLFKIDHLILSSKRAVVSDREQEKLKTIAGMFHSMLVDGSNRDEEGNLIDKKVIDEIAYLGESSIFSSEDFEGTISEETRKELMDQLDNTLRLESEIDTKTPVSDIITFYNELKKGLDGVMKELDSSILNKEDQEIYAKMRKLIRHLFSEAKDDPRNSREGIHLSKIVKRINISLANPDNINHKRQTIDLNILKEFVSIGRNFGLQTKKQEKAAKILRESGFI